MGAGMLNIPTPYYFTSADFQPQPRRRQALYFLLETQTIMILWVSFLLARSMS